MVSETVDDAPYIVVLVAPPLIEVNSERKCLLMLKIVFFGHALGSTTGLHSAHDMGWVKKDLNPLGGDLIHELIRVCERAHKLRMYGGSGG